MIAMLNQLWVPFMSLEAPGHPSRLSTPAFRLPDAPRKMKESQVQLEEVKEHQEPSDASRPRTARLVIKKMVLENFKSYAGKREIGPFHKVQSAIPRQMPRSPAIWRTVGRPANRSTKARVLPSPRIL